MRPCIGFIVEGAGEYESYPTLLTKIINQNGIEVPRVNAGGCGSIMRNLSEHLSDIHKVNRPSKIIITIDSDDILKARLAESHEQILEILNAQVCEWVRNSSVDARMIPLPNSIICLLQVRKFETWVISDLDGLSSRGYVLQDCPEVVDAEAVTNPDTFIRRHTSFSNGIKNPRDAKTAISSVRPDLMRAKSISFSLFYKECQEGYQAWLQEIAAN